MLANHPNFKLEVADTMTVANVANGSVKAPSFAMDETVQPNDTHLPCCRFQCPAWINLVHCLKTGFVTAMVLPVNTRAPLLAPAYTFWQAKAPKPLSPKQLRTLSVCKLTNTHGVWDHQLPGKVAQKTILKLGYTLIPGTHTAMGHSRIHRIKMAIQAIHVNPGSPWRIHL